MRTALVACFLFSASAFAADPPPVIIVPQQPPVIVVPQQMPKPLPGTGVTVVETKTTTTTVPMEPQTVFFFKRTPVRNFLAALWRS